ncbi:hypothetical protein HW130_13835 [Streptomyces sp. PKU-EA00015]|uniref:hypothetical protein n=1 Tax=Streptomyces sp. PKU-EA00015 TaxID=2748326 RepID=UPI0015A3A7EE|nr:hypothetical protein [Streptomyces sp. PKU-EA00015]NWF27339.1 hypothetical protein [Streptomyces sp. PKU-EA00015]
MAEEIPLWRRPTRGGWRVDVDETRTRADVIDPSGQVRASVAIEPVPHFTGWFAKRQNAVTSRAFETNGPSLPARTPTPVTLRPHDEQAFVSDGTHSGRRREKAGRALVHGRSYAFLHTGGQSADAVRDGTRIASFAKHGFRPHDGHVSRDDHHVLDETDELVMTLFEKLLRPGRPGAVSDILTDLT